MMILVISMVCGVPVWVHKLDVVIGASLLTKTMTWRIPWKAGKKPKTVVRHEPHTHIPQDRLRKRIGRRGLQTSVEIPLRRSQGQDGLQPIHTDQG
jgi:hypothetical protein